MQGEGEWRAWTLIFVAHPARWSEPPSFCTARCVPTVRIALLRVGRHASRTKGGCVECEFEFANDEERTMLNLRRVVFILSQTLRAPSYDDTTLIITKVHAPLIQTVAPLLPLRSDTHNASQPRQ